MDGEGRIKQTIVCIQANEEGGAPMRVSKPWKSEVKPAPLEPRGNVSDEFLNAVCGKLTAICFMWRLGLTPRNSRSPRPLLS